MRRMMCWCQRGRAVTLPPGSHHELEVPMDRFEAVQVRRYDGESPAVLPGLSGRLDLELPELGRFGGLGLREEEMATAC